MRIIAGEHRGRRIKAPEGEATRPMLDRVRESLFSTLQDWIEGAEVLDLFAGSGSLGLEALSRGARGARLIESDRRTAEILRDNVRTLGLDDRASVVCGDALDARRWSATGPSGDAARFDLVFVDPPYPMVRERRPRRVVLDSLERLARDHLAPTGRIVLHAPHEVLAAEDFANSLTVESRRYGTNDLWYVGPRRAETSEPA